MMIQLRLRLLVCKLIGHDVMRFETGTYPAYRYACRRCLRELMPR